MAQKMPENDRLRSSENQNLQQELIEQAAQQPGLAEALAVYQAILPYLPPQPLAPRPQVRYSTGGNS